MENDSAPSANPPAPAPDPSKHLRQNSTDTERPTSAQRIRPESPSSSKSTSDDETAEPSKEAAIKAETEQDDESDPAEKIPDYDWDDLAKRYHDAIRECSAEEEQLADEFAKLMDFFKVWAQSGHDGETGRTHLRLKARMEHVQHSEEVLEQKREHYIRVVKAFESALNLLNAQMGT
ncbi:hypothetical protein BS50DRAFT_576797 [Corynespora cassiicola Philippines]|uniref:Uncharacterized protein n=1 Tax=Corynespora cassiicola Philippines TaxID=1448308 RepID=A0A2T2NBY2_CORCC|nr:hypothetical protein BS50DRAFT_576797 [Corynespora cassiicola Philippines]